MRKHRTAIITALISILSIVAFVGYGVITAERNKVRLVKTVQNLKDIAVASALYQDEFQVLPHNIRDLPVEDASWEDPSTGTGFWEADVSNYSSKKTALIARQASSVRISSFPWGERRRYAAFSDGTVRDIHNDWPTN